MKPCSKCKSACADDAQFCANCGEDLNKKSSRGVVIGAVVAAILVLGALPVVGILAAIAIPNFVEMQYRAKRSEVPSTVKALRTSEMGHYAKFGEYLPCGSEQLAQALLTDRDPKEPHAWGASGCDVLGWAPEGQVRGAYWVSVSEDGQHFEVHGISNVDRYREQAHYFASDTEPTTMLSPMNAY